MSTDGARAPRARAWTGTHSTASALARSRCESRDGGEEDVSDDHARGAKRASHCSALDHARARREGLPNGQARVPGAPRRRPGDQGRRDGRDRRPVRERQDDDHEHDHRHRPADCRHRRRRRTTPARDERGAARDLARRQRRHRLPVLPAAADADRARERDAAARLRPPRLQARALRDREAQPRTGRTRATSSTTCPRSCRVGSSSEWRSHARSPPIRS